MTQMEEIRQKKWKDSRDREQSLKKLALSLLKQCESEKLTIRELFYLLEFMKAYCENNIVIRDLPDV